MSQSESANSDISTDSSEPAFQDKPSFDDYHFDKGKRVTVDWSDNEGPHDEISGVVEDISLSVHGIIVSVVDYENEQFANGRTYDAAPE